MKENINLDFTGLVSELLYPAGQEAKANKIIKVGNIIGRLDPLTEFQQKIIVGVISLVHKRIDGTPPASNETYVMELNEILKSCDVEQAELSSYLINEIEKLVKKGIWLYEEATQKLTRTHWFQSIEISNRKVVFQFAEKIVPIVTEFTLLDTELQIVKGLRYKGKHTGTVFEMIWKWRNQGIIEYSIPEIMKQLSLEHTRYSYGQLRLRVIEPSIEEIYAWDDSVFIRFGPTFAGRRVEGVWFEVKAGEEARRVRQQYPDFKFSSPEDKING
ncbi:MAG: Initiator Replication protein [Firmicutes bacterium]|nr:Initiator Replication protein [Bacillota bacterium]